MTATVIIKIDTAVGRERMQRAIAAFDLRSLLKRVGARLQGFVDESFRTHGRGTWPPLAWLTVAMRARGGSQPLQDQGSYRQSWTTRTFESPAGGYAEVGTRKTPLAFWLEFGTGGKAVGGGSPYTIRLRSANVLAARLGGGTGRFQLLGGGSTRRGGRNANYIFFGKEVTHPGIPPRPVLPNTRQAEALLGEVVRGVEAQIAGGVLPGPAEGL